MIYVIVPYVQGMLMDEVIEELHRAASPLTVITYHPIPAAPQVHSAGYLEVLTKEWEKADGVIVIEQDIAIRPGVLEELWNCPEPWCGFIYSIGGNNHGNMLGCTKFSKQLMLDEPSLMQSAGVIRFHTGCPVGCWHNMDRAISQSLQNRGYTFHEHEPAVNHLHDYGTT